MERKQVLICGDYFFCGDYFICGDYLICWWHNFWVGLIHFCDKRRNLLTTFYLWINNPYLSTGLISHPTEGSLRNYSVNNRCSVCNGDLSKNNSKTVPCMNLGCSAQTHSKCFRKHICPYSTTTRKKTIGMTSFLALDNEDPVSPFSETASELPSSFVQTAPSVSMSALTLTSSNKPPGTHTRSNLFHLHVHTPH